MMIVKKIYYLFLLLCQIVFSHGWIFSAPTYKFINSSDQSLNLNGFMAAFGDFNADRAVDVFVLDKTNNIQHLDVILMAKEDSKKLPKRISLFNDTSPNGLVRNVVAGDFNGDSYLDIVTYNSQNFNGPYSVEIAYGVSNRNSLDNPISIYNSTFSSQPLHLDWNADMIGDIFGQRYPNNDFVVLIGNKNKTFTEIPLNYPLLSVIKFDELFYYFVDLSNDGQADILMVGKTGSKLTLYSIVKKDLDFILQKNVTIPDISFVGQPVIADFLFNGNLHMLIPHCSDRRCQNSKLTQIDLLSFDYKEILFGNELKMAFQVRDGSSNGRLSLTLPYIVPMSCGDIKMSGYIGCLIPMLEIGNPGNKKLVRLDNKGTFQLQLVNLEGASNLFEDVSQVAIFDLLEDGIPDVIISKQQGNTGLISLLRHETSGDSYFLKVMVLNGLCATAESCPQKKFPFGIPLPGINVSYDTEGINGEKQTSVVAMVTTSSHTSLMLPYAFFGLSPFSNYIETLTIQLPYNKVVRKHILKFIVPKTQIIIIPYPLDSPDKWANKLLLEPFADRKVLYVAGALLGTMVLVAVILCILQYLEIREDRLEKMQDAQKFNFDAM